MPEKRSPGKQNIEAATSLKVKERLSYDGQVAVVTGAGQGLGKEYALLLAAAGAKVIVNDLGTDVDGSGSSNGPADAVVALIKAAGGEAVANYDSVEEGEKIIQTAIDSFGRIDILVNNAGFVRDVTFKKMTKKDWDAVYRVFLLGLFQTTRAAWPHFEKQQFGRVVNISSTAGLYGNYGQVNFGTMMRAIIGFTISIAREGRKKNIKANVVSPLAASRMTAQVLPQTSMSKLSPQSVASLVGYLCHESCRPSGGIFEVGGSWIAKLRWQRSRGVRFDGEISPADIADRYDDIEDFSFDAEFPQDSEETFQQALAAPKNSSKL